jgi:predicted metal-binding membrane protein
VFAEKLLSSGRLVSYTAGTLLVLTGTWALAGL